MNLRKRKANQRDKVAEYKLKFLDENEYIVSSLRKISSFLYIDCNRSLLTGKTVNGLNRGGEGRVTCDSVVAHGQRER